MHCSRSILGTTKLLRGKQIAHVECKHWLFIVKPHCKRSRKGEVLNACDPRLVFGDLLSLKLDVRIQVFHAKGNLD
jgi:hypothetical protein